MDNKYRLDIYKERYYNEINDRYVLDSRITLSISLITLLFGAIPTYFLPLLINNIKSNKIVLLLIVLILMCVSLVLSTIYLIKMYMYPYLFHNFKLRMTAIFNRKHSKHKVFWSMKFSDNFIGYIYNILPLPGEIELYYEELEEEYGEEAAQDIILNYMISMYANAIEINTDLNMLKETYLQKTNAFVLLALFFALLLLFLQYFGIITYF